MSDKDKWLNKNNRDEAGPDDRFSSSGVRFFEIRLKGQLDSCWSDWLEGLQVKLLDNGEMILFGPLADQAALMGVLDKLNRLNLTILSLNELKKENN